MEHLEHLWKKGKDFLGVKTPIIAGAMTWISDSRFIADCMQYRCFWMSGCRQHGLQNAGFGN